MKSSRKASFRAAAQPAPLTFYEVDEYGTPSAAAVGPGANNGSTQLGHQAHSNQAERHQAERFASPEHAALPGGSAMTHKSEPPLSQAARQLQPQRPIERLTHVLRSESGLYFRVRGYGGGLGNLAQAHPMTRLNAQERARTMVCREGLPFVVEPLAAPFWI